MNVSVNSRNQCTNFNSESYCISLAMCDDSSHGEVTGDSSSATAKQDVFKKLFILHRVEQLNAVKKIQAMPEDKQLMMVKTVAKTMFNVLQKSKSILEESNYTPGESQFPEKEAIRDALSLVLENTSLMGDLVLRLPDVTEPVLRSMPEWLPMMAWGVRFANQSQLVDNSTATLINLVGQELNLTTRHPRYVNPYRKKEQVKPNEGDQTVKKKKKKKDPLPRGPRLTLAQIREL